MTETFYLQGLFYCSENIMCKRFHLEAEDSPFSHLSWSASRTLITPICLISCQFGGSCFSLPKEPHCLQDVWFPAMWPASLFPASVYYLTAITSMWYGLIKVQNWTIISLGNWKSWACLTGTISYVICVCVCVLYFMSASAITWRNWIKKLILLDNQMFIY